MPTPMPGRAVRGSTTGRPINAALDRCGISDLRYRDVLVPPENSRILHERIPVFVGVDSPDFNLGLEGVPGAKNVRTVFTSGTTVYAGTTAELVAERKSVR